MLAYVMEVAFCVAVVLGGLALVLTVSGLFSVLSYLVEQRAKDIGVHVALRATTPDDARARSFQMVFVPGLAERIFPQRPREDPLLLDVLREQLGNRGVRQRGLQLAGWLRPRFLRGRVILAEGRMSAFRYFFINCNACRFSFSVLDAVQSAGTNSS